MVLNLSLMTSDFYVAVISVLAFGAVFNGVYLIGFGLVVAGLFVYAFSN